MENKKELAKKEDKNKEKYFENELSDLRDKLSKINDKVNILRFDQKDI